MSSVKEINNTTTVVIKIVKQNLNLKQTRCSSFTDCMYNFIKKSLHRVINLLLETSRYETFINKNEIDSKGGETWSVYAWENTHVDGLKIIKVSVLMIIFTYIIQKIVIQFKSSV